MTDPQAPPGYRFDKEKKLDKVLNALRKDADALNDLSFGDAASEVHRAVARIEHHTKEDTWTRLSRATVSYMAQAKTLPAPHVSVSYMGKDSTADALHVQFQITLDGTVQEFIDRYDPRNSQ